MRPPSVLRARVAWVTRPWRVSFPSLPAFLPLSLCLLLPLIIHEMQSQESERERVSSCWNTGTNPQESWKRRGVKRGWKRLKTLLSCWSARWLDGRLCGEEGEDSWRGRLVFPSSSLHCHVQVRTGELSWAELSRRSTLRIEGEGKRTWLAWWAWLQIHDHPVSVLTFKRLTESLRWHNSVCLTHRSTLLPPGQWLITEQRKAVSFFYKAQCFKQRVMLLIKKKKKKAIKGAISWNWSNRISCVMKNTRRNSERLILVCFFISTMCNNIM